MKNAKLQQQKAYNLQIYHFRLIVDVYLIENRSPFHMPMIRECYILLFRWYLAIYIVSKSRSCSFSIKRNMDRSIYLIAPSANYLLLIKVLLPHSKPVFGDLSNIMFYTFFENEHDTIIFMACTYCWYYQKDFRSLTCPSQISYIFQSRKLSNYIQGFQYSGIQFPYVGRCTKCVQKNLR